ncbi:MAG TPA: Smr/MutS family protein [Acetobacteraceae bacterium]|nr:Smr/MutS family protein [Acetobacteraceae bacterium]
MKPPPEASSEDRAAWRRFAGSVRPLGAPAREPPLPAASPPVRAEPVRAPSPRSSRQLAPLAIGTAPPGLDRASWRRLAGGQNRPARRLDLHGLTAARALAALEAFLEAASADGERTVEVITGRGTGAEGGVIRREFAHWLNLPSLRPLLLGASHPHPANPGAVLLLLRRKR